MDYGVAANKTYSQLRQLNNQPKENLRSFGVIRRPQMVVSRPHCDPNDVEGYWDGLDR